MTSDTFHLYTAWLHATFTFLRFQFELCLLVNLHVFLRSVTQEHGRPVVRDDSPSSLLFFILSINSSQVLILHASHDLGWPDLTAGAVCTRQRPQSRRTTARTHNTFYSFEKNFHQSGIKGRNDHVPDHWISILKQHRQKLKTIDIIFDIYTFHTN